MSQAIVPQLLAALHALAAAPEALFLPLGAAAAGIGLWAHVARPPPPPEDAVQSALLAAAFGL